MHDFRRFADLKNPSTEGSIRISVDGEMHWLADFQLANLGIVDLGNAVNLKTGEVEFSSDLVAVRPKNARRGNGSMLLEIPNRGRWALDGVLA